MTKIDIFSGFLGAGKTTLIKKLIKESYNKEKVVLIENEFGEVGIDGGFMRDAGIEITEMNSGCICCSLVGDFGEALKKVIKEYAKILYLLYIVTKKEKDYNEIIRKVPEQLIRRKHYAGEKFKFIAGKQIWLLSADVFSGGYGTDDLSDDFYDRLYQNPGRDRGNDTSGSACD